jgi:saccharopine dehydrogenase-like NADP-dependent oxidoreductase
MTKITLEDYEKTGLDERGRRFEQAAQEAVRAALLEHKRHNNPVAVWRDGKVVMVPPEEISETGEIIEPPK